jgi:hypothetical protein
MTEIYREKISFYIQFVETVTGAFSDIYLISHEIIINLYRTATILKPKYI